MTNPKWITESYISPRALPNEQILGWIKWNTKFSFDKILIKHDPDMLFQRIMHVEESVFEKGKILDDGIQFENGIVEINKDIIQIPGFMGFRAIYTPKPEDEKELSFLVEFILNDDLVDSIELTTTLVRPKLVITEAPSAGIVVNKFVPVLPSLSFTLKNLGHSEVDKIAPFLDVQSCETKKMKIEVKYSQQKDTSEDHVFVLTTTRNIPKIIISGSGMGMINMGFEYYDKMNNKYETELVNIPLDIPEKENLEIPVSSTISNKQTLLLEQELI